MEDYSGYPYPTYYKQPDIPRQIPTGSVRGTEVNDHYKLGDTTGLQHPYHSIPHSRTCPQATGYLLAHSTGRPQQECSRHLLPAFQPTQPQRPRAQVNCSFPAISAHSVCIPVGQRAMGEPDWQAQRQLALRNRRHAWSSEEEYRKMATQIASMQVGQRMSDTDVNLLLLANTSPSKLNTNVSGVKNYCNIGGSMANFGSTTGTGTTTPMLERPPINQGYSAPKPRPVNNNLGTFTPVARNPNYNAFAISPPRANQVATSAAEFATPDRFRRYAVRDSYQRALDELDELERCKTSTGRYVTRQGLSGYQPPFTTPNYSPVSSSSSSLSGMSSEMSSVGSYDDSEEEELEESVEPSSPRFGTSDGQKTNIATDAGKSSPYERQLPRRNRDDSTSIPFVVGRAEVGSHKWPSGLNRATQTKPVLVTTPPVLAPTAPSPTATMRPAIPAVKAAVLPQFPMAGIPALVPRTNTFTPRPPATAVPAPTSNDRHNNRWSVSDLFGQQMFKPAPPVKKHAVLPEPSPSHARMQESKVEWWQRWGPSQSKEIQVSKEVPSIPPPFPSGISAASACEIWVEDISKEHLFSGGGTTPAPQAEDWEIVEESEVYEQDEQDWQTVKALDNDIVERNREEKKIRTYV
ncbi:hypothetical protein TWF481_011678 [Arthrobotrys musiformis]|uniref:Uncharacterized protein n=1 Tax=Arthrobotrys musiformis TaxID=47236 RepID=A0AAV9W0W7_9PEZI